MKIFRKIRYDRILHGKIKDYLIYSIGEILLVVIGILLAVQVNNWNQSRITAKKEIQLLKDIQSEFNLNQRKISEKQNLRIITGPLIKNYISDISTGKANSNSFKIFHQSDFMHGMTNPSIGVIDALISSNEISIITNDSLKYLLAGWKNQLENLYENEQILWNSGLELIGSYSNEIPDSKYTWFDSSDNDLIAISNNILKRTYYRNKLVGFAGCNEIVIEECKEILDDIKIIIAKIKEEIELKK